MSTRSVRSASLESMTLADDDPGATNSLEHLERVTPMPNRSVRIEDGL